MTEQKIQFKAEVAKLLDIVVHSFYSEKEIFLRELISNSSDACDKLRYMSLTKPDLAEDSGKYAIWIIPNKEERTLIIADNGVGMNKDDLIENLGTIAKSGSEEFINRITSDDDKDFSLIGQFGVGFYSAFMVSEKVEVLTRKAGEKQGWKWTSTGEGEFSVSEAENIGRGTRIKLFLKEEQDKFTNPTVLRQIVRTHSDHIALPIVLVQGKDEDKKEETINTASALWTRNKAEITVDQYKEFYHHVSHSFDEPWLTLHYKAEGAIEYTGLLFIPTEQPFDLFQPDRKPHLKLYVNRVFVTDDCSVMMPAYLRFVNGIVDSSDVPLNISREFLQHNPV